MCNSKNIGLLPPKPATEVLDMYFLDARSHLLETAAILDRIERAPGGKDVMREPKIKMLFKICEMLTETNKNRAEHFLTMMSKTTEQEA